MTIMRAFTAASRIKEIAIDGNLPETMRLMVEELDGFLNSSRLGGMGRNFNEDRGLSSYKVIPRGSSHRLTPGLLQALQSSSPQSTIAPIQRLCDLQKANMDFSAGSKSSRDSQISYLMGDGEIRFGRIFSIMTEDSGEAAESSDDSTLVVVERYLPLSPEDALRDPYGTHPLTGRTGYNICGIVYDVFSPQMDVIRPSAIIGHIARCSLKNEEPLRFQFDAIVVVQLDRVSTFAIRRGYTLIGSIELCCILCQQRFREEDDRFGGPSGRASYRNAGRPNTTSTKASS